MLRRDRVAVVGWRWGKGAALYGRIKLHPGDPQHCIALTVPPSASSMLLDTVVCVSVCVWNVECGGRVGRQLGWGHCEAVISRSTPRSI